MRKLMIVLISLVALFTFIRAYTDEIAAEKAASSSVIERAAEV